jgi:hypothetical protein
LVQFFVFPRLAAAATKGRGLPPKNGQIALWLNTRVVKCEQYVSEE